MTEQATQNNRRANTQPKRRPAHAKSEMLLKQGIEMVEFIGLVIISLATVVAGYIAVETMFLARTVTLGDLLLLFLYLEVLAMVAIYLESGKLPVRLPLYIAIVALARYLILDIKELTELEIVAIAVTILLITLSTLSLRYGHKKFPYNEARRSTD